MPLALSLEPMLEPPCPLEGLPRVTTPGPRHGGTVSPREEACQVVEVARGRRLAGRH